MIPVVEAPVLDLSMSGGDMEFTWAGNFKVQECTNLLDGIWTDVPGANMSPVTVGPTNSAAFFRLIEQ